MKVIYKRKAKSKDINKTLIQEPMSSLIMDLEQDLKRPNKNLSPTKKNINVRINSKLTSTPNFVKLNVVHKRGKTEIPENMLRDKNS